MLGAIFTLDYEIHGSGAGCPKKLMIEPTARLLRQFDEFGAKLTIMADVAEILRFKQYASDAHNDEFHSHAIEQQLRDAIIRGHDVQLHIHSSYFGARAIRGRWLQHWMEYDFATLPRPRMDWMIRVCKQYLETLLKPVNSNYRCDVFRAANWSVSPSTNVIAALLDNDIRIDSSVFKHGRRTWPVQFDYSSAFSALVPWRVRADDICAPDNGGRLWEFPIYSELRGISAFVNVQRAHQVIASRIHRLSYKHPSGAGQVARAMPPIFCTWRELLRRRAWKADFNQCSGRQLIAAIERARAQFDTDDQQMPFVLIGHSKLFSRLNERSLRPFLSYIRQHPDHLRFSKFSDFATRFEANNSGVSRLHASGAAPA